METPGEHRAKTLILIFDKDNLLGAALGKQLVAHGTVVLVSGESGITEDELIVVPYRRGVPQIPDGWYTHIVFVWSKGEEELLEPFAKKAKEQQAQFFIISSLKDAESMVADSIDLDYPPQRLVVGDIFGEKHAPLDTYLQQAKNSGKISLPNMGLQSWWPVFFQDVVSRVADLVLVSKKLRSTLFIGPGHASSALGLFHTIQKSEPDLKIDFSSEHEEERVMPLGTEPAFAHYDSAAKLRQYYQQMVVHKKERGEKQVETVVHAHQQKVHKKQSKFWYIGYILLVAILLPLLSASFAGGVGALALFVGVQRVEHGGFAEAKLATGVAQQCFSYSQNALEVVQVEASLVGGGKTVTLIEQRAKLAEQAASLATSGISLAQSLSAVFLGKTIAPEEDVVSSVASLKQFSYALSQVNRKVVPAQFLPVFDSLQHLGGIGASVADELPQVIGANGDRSYLVLFQNNMELRPGGGFIGSYGVLTLHLGAVKSFTIHNVYDADGQLQGHVEPPFAIRRYIPVVNLFLRDSNFDPDFSVDAQKAAFMLSQETGQRVDGVIGVDLDALKGILASVGSVYVPSYNQSVTTENFFTLIEEHAEKNTFPGSTQKQQFLNAFFSALLAQVRDKKTLNASTLVQEVDSLVKGKHVMIGFVDPYLQLPFSMSRVSGSLADNRPQGSGALNDFLGIVEANIGVNKANAYVTRGVSQHVAIDTQGNANELTVLTLTNTSDGTWPGGPYRNYVRFILPSNAVLQSISLNGVDQHMVAAVTDPKVYEAKGFVPPKGLEIDKTEEAGKTLYGFLVAVPEKGTLAVAFRYQIAHAVSLNQGSYNMLLWKQAGVDSYPYQLQVSAPQGTQLLGGSMRIDGQTAQFTTNVDGDLQASISFAPQGN